MTFRCIGDRVVVKRIPRADMTPGGLHIPQTALEAPPSVAGDLPTTAVVVAIGPKVRGIKLGDVVVHAKHGGEEMRRDGAWFAFFSEAEIEGILECQTAPA